jgi:hypothetical protein
MLWSWVLHNVMKIRLCAGFYSRQGNEQLTDRWFRELLKSGAEATEITDRDGKDPNPGRS